MRRLIATCDVIVENFTPRVLDQIGLDFAAVQAIRPDAIMLRMPGFGLDGPWRDNPAFAYVIEAASGLSWLTGYPDRNPYEPYSIGDPNAGVHALNALLLALEHRRRTGEGVLSKPRWSTRHSTSPPNRSSSTPPTGRCCSATAIADRRPRRRTCTKRLTSTSSAGWTAGSRSPSRATSSGQDCARRSAGRNGRWIPRCRLRTAADNDTTSSTSSWRAWCRDRSGDDIVRCLWDAGVPVGKVMQPHRQTEIPQLHFRRFFEDVGHPVNRRVPHSTVPVRFSAGPDRFHLKPAPLLGEHNVELLTELGLTKQQIADLEADGVIGHAPGSAKRAAAR